MDPHCFSSFPWPDAKKNFKIVEAGDHQNGRFVADRGSGDSTGTDKANRSIESVNAHLSGIEASTTKAARPARQGIDGITASMV